MGTVLPTEQPFSLLPAEKEKDTLQHSCEECNRLWRHYAEATTVHIRLNSKFEIAALSHQVDLIAELTPHMEQAKIARTEARDAIREHESAAHPSAGMCD